MSGPARVLDRDFYARPTLEVARELVGRWLVSRDRSGTAAGMIVETEAYRGPDDPASHAALGPTPRSRVMFGRPGVAYVYFIYGMHHCFNAVTEPAGTAGAVLVRALEPAAGLALMRRRRSVEEARLLASGPGRLCQALGIRLEDKGRDLTAGRRLWIEDHGRPAGPVLAAPRVGIREARERPWRFYLGGNPCVSARPGGRPPELVAAAKERS